MRHATGSFTVSSMHEETYAELPGGGKLTRASGDQAYTGDMVGRGAVQWLMSYRGDGTAHFVGIWHLTVAIDGHAGSLVLESVGDFDGKASHGTISVVDGLGQGDLGSITGSGRFSAPGGADATYELEYEFDRHPE